MTSYAGCRSRPSASAAAAFSTMTRSWYVVAVVAVTLVPGLSVFASDDGSGENFVYVLVGRDIVLPCRTASPNTEIEWLDYANNEIAEPINVRSRISNYKETYAEKHEIAADNTLTIRTAESKDAGKYICRQLTSQSVVISYYVTVHSALNCSGKTSLKPGDSTELGCKSVFYGRIDCSQLQWYRRSASVSGSSDGADLRVKSTDNCEVAILERSVKIDDVTQENDRDQYVCRLALGDSSEQCQLVLGVEHSVRNVQFQPNKSVYSVGEQIRCTARGHPSPSIVLRSSSPSAVSDDESGTGKSITVQKSWVGLKEPIQLTCTASNTVQGQQSSLTETITFTVTEKAPEKDTSSTKSASGSSVAVTIGLGSGIVILAAIIAAVVCMRLRKDRQEAKESKSPPPAPAAAGSTQKQDLFKNEKAGKVDNSKC